MNLKELSKQYMSSEQLEQCLKDSTVFDKIEFSDISKEEIKNKLIDLDRQVAERTVYLDAEDSKIKLGWFKNWLHPKLKHFIKRKRIDSSWGHVSTKDRERVAKLDYLHTYENGQQNFSYTLEDIENYIKGE
ncbi:MAG: hypothetical protein ACRCX2_09355 [Paraclostridium sp.]